MRPFHCYIWGVAVLMVLTALTGCDTMVQDEEEPPELIPPQAFTVQTELFNQRRSGKATIDPHFMAAVMRVWPVSTALESQLYLPARLTRAALNKQPTIQGDAWVWSATTSVEGEPLAFTLTGRTMGGEVDWTLEIVHAAPRSSPEGPEASIPEPSIEAPTTSADSSWKEGTATPLSSAAEPVSAPSDSVESDSMFIASDSLDTPSSTAPAADGLQQELQALIEADSSFVLYTAQTQTDGTQGQWRLYDTVDGERTNVLNGTFKIEKANKMELSLAVPAVAPEHGGDSIVYAQDDDQRRLRWVRAREGQMHRITWNVRNHQGSITATNYNEGQAACWGKQLDNVTCSE